MTIVRFSARSIVLSLLTILPAAAQTLTVHPPAGPGATVEMLLPDFKTVPGQETSALILRTTLHLRAGERSVVQVVMPYLRFHSRYSYTTPSFTFSSEERNDGLMNLGLGIITRPGENSAWEFLMTVPLVSEQNSSLGVVGLMSDFDRFESYVRKVVTAGVYGNLLTAESSTFVGRLRVGPTVWLPTEDRDNEVEAAADAGLGVGVRFGPIECGAFVTTRTILTEEKWFDDKTMIHTTLSVQVALPRFRVQGYYRLPHSEDLKQNMNGSLGIAGSVTW